MSEHQWMTAEDAYQQIADIARKYGLIFEAAGGVITVVHPRTAKEEGIWQVMQRMAGLQDVG